MSVSTQEPQQCIARPPSPLYGVGSGAPQSKDFTERTLKSLKVSLGKLWRRRSVTITEYDPTYKCAYLGNVLTGWAKGEGCVEKPLSTLWKNYTSSSKPDVQMKVSVTHSGLKAVTKEHGLTEYWSHRITYCAAPAAFPRIFCWVYRHEGRKLKQELRCHAVLCAKEAVAKRMATQLRSKLAQALHEFKRDKICRQNARLSLANSVYDNPSLPRRKILLSTGSHNYRPPLERSKSAPKLMAIEESLEEDEEAQPTPHSRFLLRINSVPLAKQEIKQLSPQHMSRLFQRVGDARLFATEEEPTEAATAKKEHVFDVQPVREQDLEGGVAERRFIKSPLVRRNSIKRVGWAVQEPERRHTTTCHTERLLVLGGQEDEELAVKEAQDESDENSLQSISSSGSCSSDTSATMRNLELTVSRQYSLPLLYQDQRNIGGGGRDEDETHDEESVVDLRPAADKVLPPPPSALKRSVTFPQPRTAQEELDSLSDEEAGKEEEEAESDESGYAEITEKEFEKPDDVKGQHRQIIKSILRPTNRNSHCVQV